MKKITSLILALLIPALAPGLEAYAAAGRTFIGRPGGSPKLIRYSPLQGGLQGLRVPGAAGFKLPKTAITQVGDQGTGTVPNQPGAATGTDPEAGRRPVEGETPPGPDASSNKGELFAKDGSNPAEGTLGEARGAQDDPGEGKTRSAETEKAEAGKVFDASLRGKTLLLVGTSRARPFILEETKRVADAMGLRLVVVDKPEARAQTEGVIPDSDFIPAPNWHIPTP